MHVKTSPLHYLSIMKLTTNLQENFPFITVIAHADTEYVGIIINQDTHVTTMYDFASLRSDEEKQVFLELGETWWWQSHRKIPINIFLRNEMTMFAHAIKSFMTKDVKIVLGPVVNLSELGEKRVKRKSIQLIRKIKP